MPNSFERRHDILIDAPPEAVYDYVCNPNFWPKWLAASHHIDSAEQIQRVDEEAQIGLNNIKRQVEQRIGAQTGS